MSGVEIRVRANAAQAQREIRKTGNTLKGLETQAAQVTKTFQRMAIGLTAVFAGRGITRGINSAADAMIGLNNRVKLVTKDAITTQKTVRDLFDIAARSGGSIDAAAETFNRFGLALRGSGKSVDQLLVVTEAVQKAAIISGSGAESAKAAIIQLGQGLASGQLRGQELNSVLEQMPRLAQAIAEGMDIPFGKLRENAAEGKITAEAVFQALIDGAVKIDEEFATLQFTTADLATVMKNELTRAISEFDRVTGFSEGFKLGILELTGVFRFLGQNIERWSILTQLSFLIVESQAKDFFQGLLDLFRGDFDAAGLGKRLGESIRTALLDAKNFGVQKVELALDFSVKKYNLIKSMFPDGTAGIYGTLFTFKEKIIEIFTALWKAIVGDSWWTGIFDPAHEEAGKAAIGNVASWGKHLDTARNYIAGWAVGLTQVFSDLSFEVADSWQLLVGDIETKGFSTVASERIVEPLKTAFTDAIYEMATAYNVFALSPAGMKLSLPTTAELEEDWNNTLDRMTTAFDSIIETFKNTPIAIGATVAFESISDNLSEITQGVEDFFSENSAELTTAVSVGMAAALNKGLRTSLVRAAIPAGILAAVGGLGQNQDFLNAVGKTARAWGETFKNLISGDGDVLANILEGLTNVFSAIGTGFVDGLFGEDFESAFVDNAATAISAGLVTLAVAPTLTVAAGKFGIKLGGLIFASSVTTAAAGWVANSLTGVAAATGVIGSASKVRTAIAALLFSASMTKPKVITALSGALDGAAKGRALLSSAAALGGKVIAGIGLAFTARSIGEMLGDALNLNAVDISFDEFGDEIRTSTIGSTIFNIFNDAIAGAILGFTVAGPWGALAGALGGALLGIFMSEEQKNGIINMFDVVGDAVYDGLSAAWERFKSLASDWTPDWIKRVLKPKEGFSTGTTPNDVNEQGQVVLDRDIPEDVERAKYLKDAGVPFIYKASGGYVSGAGTGTSDDVPAMLSNGEYVIKAAAVDRIGKTKLDLMNQGILPKFAKGGIVGRAEREIKDSFARGDTALAMEIIGLVDQLGRLDEVTANLTDEMTEAVKAVAKTAAETKAAEERDKGIEDLKQAFNNRLAQSISDVLHGGSWKDALHGLLDSVTSNILNNFSQGLADGITKDLDFASIFDGLGDIFKSASGLGANSGLGGIFGSIAGFLGFSQGGIVPNTMTSQAGKDSVPAMLTPGEVVLSKNDVARANNNQGTSQSFNINITGDVSRQTRQEIVKMIPQITSGVNSQNKEANYRR